MTKQDSLHRVYKIILDDIKKEWKTPKIDEEWISNILSPIRDDTEEPKWWIYLESAPNEDGVKERIKELSETILTTKERVERTEIRNRRLYREILQIFEDVKILKNDLEESKKELYNSKKELDNLWKRTERINNLVVWCFVVFFITFVWWIIEDFQFRHNKTDSWNKDIIRMEYLVDWFEEKIKNNKEDFDEKYNIFKEAIEKSMYEKIEKEINKAMLEFYKDQDHKTNKKTE